MPSLEEAQSSENQHPDEDSSSRNDEIRRNEDRVKTEKIKQLSRENKVLRAFRGIPGEEAMKAHIDETRKKNDKVNLVKLGERLGVHGATAKRWIEQRKL